MRGYPKYLNSRQDYEYVVKHFPKAKWEADLQALLETERMWVNTAELAEGEEGLSDETHRVITVKENEGTSDADGKEKRYQQEFVINTNCKMARLGFTEEEVKSILGIE